VARIGVQVAEALAYATSQGILHRDIKPSNLLLDAQGTVWVTDFGLAKAADSEDLTHTGDVVGTLRYLPPERFQGKSDPRGDVYSLGITLYELATLRPAFTDSDRARLMERVTHEDPPRPRKLNRRLPHQTPDLWNQFAAWYSIRRANIWDSSAQGSIPNSGTWLPGKERCPLTPGIPR
jgi:serine/threonine protein kinase